MKKSFSFNLTELMHYSLYLSYCFGHIVSNHRTLVLYAMLFNLNKTHLSCLAVATMTPHVAIESIFAPKSFITHRTFVRLHRTEKEQI